MFFRLYKYSLLQTMRQKLIIFWNLLFPIILGTLFQLAFGGFTDKQVSFHQIPVAYVVEEGADESFTEVLKSLEEDSKLVKVTRTDSQEAKKLLKEEKVEGIYNNGASERAAQETGKAGQGKGEIALTVTGQHLNESILSAILERYQRTRTAFENIGRENPEGISAAAAVIEKECQYLKEGNISAEPQNFMTDYFYALIAMNCLVGVTMGLESALLFKANLTDLAARRVVASTNRFGILLPELAARLTLQCLFTTFSVCYLRYALQVPLGDRLPLVLLTTFVGNMTGISLGFLIGVAGRYKASLKEAVCISCMMVSSFLSGLMVGNMYRFIETHVPIVNRINPASLITRALYSLNIYETYDKYIQCMGSLLVLTLILGAGAFVLVRRERYASI